LHELLVAEFASHGPEDTGSARLLVVLEDDSCILVELDVGAVGTTAFLGGADDDGLDDVALLHVSAGDCVLDGCHDGVTDRGVAPTGATQDPDGQDLLGASVVGDFESRLLLNHYLLLSSRWFSRRNMSLAERIHCPFTPCPVAARDQSMVAGGTGWVGRRWLLGAFDDLDEPPTLRGRKRPRLGHEDEVADTGGVLLIVNLVLDRLAHDLAVEAVL